MSKKKAMILGLMLALAGGAIVGTVLAGGNQTPRFLNEFVVAQEIENDEFILTVDKVSLSDAETLVHLSLTDKLGAVSWDYMGEPSLRSGSLVMDGELRFPRAAVELTPSSVTQEVTVRFPALPKDTVRFTFILPKVLVQTGEHASVSIPLPESIGTAGEPIALNHVATIQGRHYRFTEAQAVPQGQLHSTDVSTPQFNFNVRYEPVGVEAASNPLTGPLTEVALSDELGNSYPLRLIDSSWDQETITVKWERLSFSGAPSGEIGTLTLDIDGLGRTVALPEPAPIGVPKPDQATGK